jgi:hypothetical protein
MKKHKERGASASTEKASQRRPVTVNEPAPQQGQSSPPLPLRYLNYLAWPLIAVPVLVGLLYVHFYGVNIAWEDQFFSITSLFEKWHAGSLRLGDFWAQHNEHRHFLPRIVMFVLGLASDWNTKDEMWLVQGLLAVNLGIVLTMLLWGNRVAWRFWLAVPPAFLIFSLRQHQNLLCGFQLSFVMAATAAMATIALLASMQNGRRVWWKFAAAMLTASLGAVSSAHGLLLWIVGLVPLALLDESWRQRGKLAAIWLSVGAVEWVVYFIGYHKTVHPIFEVQQRTIANCSEYFVTVVGGALFPLPGLAKWGGVVLLSIVALVVWLAYRRRKLRECAFWLGLLAFGLLTQAQVAWGRTPFGSGQALSSRYATFSLFVILGFYGILASIIAGRAGRLALGVGGVVLVMIGVGVGMSYWEGVEAGSELKGRMDYHAFVFLTADSQPDGTLRFAPWEKPEEIRHNLAVLKEHHLNLFSSPQSAEKWTIPPATLPVLADAPVLGAGGGFVAYDKQHIVWVLSGFALSPEGKDRAGGVVVEVDGQPYRAYYGLPIGAVTDARKPEIAKVADNPALSDCGFRREFSREQVPAGPHRLTIKVLNKDGTAWFASAPQEFSLNWPD